MVWEAGRLSTRLLYDSSPEYKIVSHYAYIFSSITNAVNNIHESGSGRCRAKQRACRHRVSWSSMCRVDATMVPFVIRPLLLHSGCAAQPQRQNRVADLTVVGTSQILIFFWASLWNFLAFNIPPTIYVDTYIIVLPNARKNFRTIYFLLVHAAYVLD